MSEEVIFDGKYGRIHRDGTYVIEDIARFAGELMGAFVDQRAAREAAETKCRAHHFGMKCFSCGVEWKPEIANQNCNQAHREHWSHEWVTQRVLDLTSSVVELRSQLATVTAERDALLAAVACDANQRWHLKAAKLESSLAAAQQRLERLTTSLRSICEYVHSMPPGTWTVEACTCKNIAEDALTESEAKDV